MAVHSELPLVTTIAVGLSAAFVFGLIASRLRLPPIVGYLVAGILVGPSTPGYIADMELANQLSEIGIVLLMFGVGLHFSLKDLSEVKRIALPGAVVQMAAATMMGACLAYWWGWSWTAGLIFGLSLSVASTVVLIRALEDHHLMQSTNGQIAIGWLIVEDIAMVLALVLVPALAVGEASQSVSTASAGAEYSAFYQSAMSLLMALVKIGLFVIVMLVVGKRLLPWLLQITVNTRSRELFTLAVFAVAVGVAFGASKLFGVSFALGAFFAGMMIRESDMNHEVADRALPFQDAFAVLFFVAVGMLFNPSILIKEPLEVLYVTLIIIVGKSLAAFLIVMAFRYPLKTALLVSAGLAQIGEFSFILIGLGYTYGIVPEEGRDLLLAGAIVSIALNPCLFGAVRWVYEKAGKHPKWSRLVDLRDTDLSHLKPQEKTALKDLIIVVGYGQIGREICWQIQSAHIDLVVIDSNRERVELLRELGYHAITGDATHIETLQEASIEKASTIIVVVPDSFEGRKIVRTAREANPDIRVIVRAHNDEEVAYFREQRVDFVSTGPRELGQSIVRYVQGLGETGAGAPIAPKV